MVSWFTRKRTESVSGAFERFERFEKMNRAGSRKENRMSTSSISDIGDGKLVPQRNIEEKENEKIRMRTKFQKLSLQQQIEPYSY